MGVVRQFTVRLGAVARGAGIALAVCGPVVGSMSSAWAQGASCAQLEASLSALDRGANSTASRQAQASRIRSDLSRLTSQASSMGCDAPRGFFIFQGPPRPPECDQISDQISRLRSALASAERSGGADSGQRRALIIALAQNNCGPQYTAAVRQAAPQQQRPRNIFEAIFGGFQNDPESSPDLEVLPIEPPKSSTYKTVCVRTCDGYYFPMSNYAGPNRFPSDEALCQRLCPATEVQLFAFGSSGADIKSATNMAGQPYMSLPNALRYRKELVPQCSCRAPGQSWAQALAGLEDKTTLGKGDILVTEEQAREMSQPKGTEPLRGTQGKTASNAPAASQVEAPSLAATAAAPLAPASEQPGQRRVKIIPLPKSRSAQAVPEEAAASADVGAASVPVGAPSVPKGQ